MKFKETLILVFAWAILSLRLAAQVPEIRFRHITYKDGLRQNPIATLIQDKAGYIWVGSWNGLLRYDGNTFKEFEPNDAVNNQISHNRINKLYADKQGRLWIGTGNGLNLFDKSTAHFLHVGLNNGKGGANYIATIQQDNYGNIWAGTFKGLKRVSPDFKRLDGISWWRNKENDLYQGVILSLAADEQNVWVGIKQGLKRFNAQNNKIIPLPVVLENNAALAAAKVVVIKPEKNGMIWFGTENDGVFKYNALAGTCDHLTTKNSGLASDLINDILIKGAEVLIATRNGLSIYHQANHTFTNYQHDTADGRSLSDDSVWSLMEDAAGNVWIGTYAGGINLYYPGSANFTNIGERVGQSTGLNKALAESIIEDNNGGLWVGTFGGGLNYINRRQHIARYFTVTDPQSGHLSNEVKALTRDTAGNLWTGTLDGLFKFNKAAGTFRYIDLHTTNIKTGAHLINTLCNSKQGIWVGTNGDGLKLIDYAGKTLTTFNSIPGHIQSLSDNYINCLLDDGNFLWIGTQNGLNRYHKTTHLFTQYRRKNAGLGNNNVLSLFLDSKHHLWIGTDGGGLNYLDPIPGKITAIKKKDGLADNYVSAIAEDNRGALWISTGNGLSKLTYNNNRFSLAKGSYTVENYNAANGLQSNQFLPNSSYKTADGELLFGGMNGITAFYPNLLIKNKVVPPILLTGMFVNNEEVPFGQKSYLKQPLNETKELTLKYDENNFTIRFSALNFINSEKNTYAYQMVGLQRNDSWIAIGNQREVTFTNLAPGHYIFKIKAANNDGFWNNQGRTLQINVRPPLWETWWAYVLYFVLTAFVFYKIIQFFQIRARLERDLYNEHLQNERQEEFYRMKLDFFTNISHEIRTPLTLILGPMEQLENATLDNGLLNRQVRNVKNNAERLLRLVSELMDFRKAETGHLKLYRQYGNVVPFIKEIFLSFQALAESRYITYTFGTTQETVMLHTDHDQLEKVFFNLLSNAFKFTPNGGVISVNLLIDDEQRFTVNITDNGKGIPQEYQSKLFTNFYQVHDEKSNAGTGIGLALSKSIVELHSGTISFASKPAAEGVSGCTVFTVKLPVDVSLPAGLQQIHEVTKPESVASFKLRAELDTMPLPEIAQTGSNGLIVLAEDNTELRNFIISSLPGYNVVAFENGADVFDYAAKEIPDLLISDVMMPVMGGLELCRKIKQDDRTSHIPVILLTALATHIHQVNGMETGADAYLTKPFSVKLLELNIRNLLAAREVMRKKFSQQVLQPRQLVLDNPDDRFLQKLMDIVEAKMEDPEFSVVELGNEIGMSKTVLYKKVCALTDLSPADFIKSMRLKRAADLLQQKLSVSEVAALVGFNDRKYFSREFKKLHGKSPSEIAAD